MVVRVVFQNRIKPDCMPHATQPWLHFELPQCQEEGKSKDSNLTKKKQIAYNK
jgi:hypothetical protein